MEQTKSSKKALIIGAVVLVVLIAAFAVIYTQFLQKPVEGAKAITVDVILADGTSQTFTYNTDAEYLGEVLQDKGLIEGTESEYGLFITSVNGVAANDANQEWWCLTKGGETVMTGADQTPIADGEHYELTLTVGY